MTDVPTTPVGWPADEDRLLLMFQALRPLEARSFLALVTNVLPHEHVELQAARIATAITLDSQMVTNLDLRALTLAGLGELDALARAMYFSAFADASRDQQATVLAEIEGAAFFQGLVHQLKYDFYNRHLVWDVLGYPDLDHEAGYLDAGFDRLDVTPATPPEPLETPRSTHA